MNRPAFPDKANPSEVIVSRTKSALALLAAALLVAAPVSARPRGSSHGSYHSHDRAHHYRTHSGHTRAYAYGAPRDKHGRIKRSSEEKKKFERETGFPHGRPADPELAGELFLLQALARR